jgi:DNA polymerase I
MNSLFIEKLEEDLKPVLVSIESRGLLMDMGKMRQIITDMEERRKLAEARAYDLLGTSQRINLNSSQELVFLLSELKIEGCTFPKTKSGKASTARDVLERINHPAVEHIIEYRSLTKLISSLTSFYNAVDTFNSRLYYKFTNDCASGRLYTQNMSIQNLPHEGRYAIVPEEGKVFLSADYDSFELRILSALSGDKYFRKCWENGIDLHKKVVSDMKGVLYEKVTDSLRKIGKILNFGIAYGQQAPGVARNLDISTSEAKELIENYENKIPEIVRFKQEAVRRARECGYVETYYGRRRYLPDLNSDDHSKQLKAERQVINTMVQGTGADIAKIVMLKLYNANLQIDAMLHDGFVLSVLSDMSEQSIAKIREIMEFELNYVKLTVTIKCGKSWGDCK